MEDTGTRQVRVPGTSSMTCARPPTPRLYRARIRLPLAFYISFRPRNLHDFPRAVVLIILTQACGAPPAWGSEISAMSCPNEDVNVLQIRGQLFVLPVVPCMVWDQNIPSCRYTRPPAIQTGYVMSTESFL